MTGRTKRVGGAMLALLVSGGSAGAATLVADNFNDLPSGSSINGRTPATTVNGAAWNTRTDAFLGNGSGGVSADSRATRSAYLDLGAGYLSSNPGVYDLVLDITNPSGITNTDGTAGQSWIGFGLAPEIAGGGVNTGQNLASANGAPWLLFRVNGAEIVFAGPGNQAGSTVFSSAANFVSTGTPHTFRLQLDTTGANWTLNSFLDGTQLDLNGGAAGLTYSYGTNPNPTGSRYVALSTGVNGAGGIGTIDNLQLTGPAPVPEPGTVGLLAVTGLGLAARRRRR